MAKIKVYLDNCTYNRPFDDQTQIMISLETEAKQHIQQLIMRRKKMGNTTTIMERGTKILLENLGVLGTEQFIATLLKDPINYTEWSREYFADYDPAKFLADAIEFDKNNPVSIK